MVYVTVNSKPNNLLNLLKTLTKLNDAVGYSDTDIEINVWKQRENYGLENESLGFIGTRHKQ